MKNIFKKVLVVALLLVSGFALFACGSNEELEAEKAAREAAEALAAEYAEEIADLEAQIAELEEGIADYEDLVAQYQQIIASQKELTDARVKAKALMDAAYEQFNFNNPESLAAKSRAKDPSFDFDDDQKAEIAQVKAIADFILEYTVDVDSLSELSAAVANAFLGFFAVTGAYCYVDYTYAQRAEILGCLEEYAVNHGLTGLTLYQTAGYALYNSGIKLGTETYIMGYGFGALSEGSITTGLDYSGLNPNWSMYYHTYITMDPGHINYADDKGSDVGDLSGYIFGSYWTTKMNEDKDGYEWVCDIALTKPVAVESAKIEGTNLSTSYYFDVPIGSALKYATLSEDPVLSAFNGREVQAEDYLTPFKYYYSQSTGWARSTETFGESSEIVGSEAYYNATAEVAIDETAWENVGIKCVAIDETTARITYTFKTPCNSFYAMYQFDSSFYAPFPQDFIDALNTAGEGKPSNGAANYAHFVTENGWTPVDTTLSTGPYVLEKWENGVEFAFKKNTLYDRGGYEIEGVHYAVLEAAKTDKEAAFKEFMAGKLSACGVPSTQIKNYKGVAEGVSTLNPEVSYYVKQTNGGSTYKLNYNALDQTTWNQLFGENGSVSQCALEDYWECEPIVSNHNFYLGVSYAIDRPALADKHAYTTSVNFFGDVYLADPENGIAYNQTEAHQKATAVLTQDEDHDGFDVEIARSYFSKACQEVLDAGLYKEGDTIVVEIAWQTPADEDEDHAIIAKNLEDAFNDPNVCGGKLTLDVVFWAGANWIDVYYDKMLVGQYDIGFGSISGNSLNPLNFMNVLKSDNSSGFTLNWGSDTSLLSEELIWDGKIWSYDALYLAADQGGYFKNGKPSPAVEPKFVSCEINPDGTQTLVLDINTADCEDISSSFVKMSLWGYNVNKEVIQTEFKLGDAGVTVDGDTVTIIIDAETLAKFADTNLYDGGDDAYIGSNHGFDITCDYVVAKIPSFGVCYDISDGWIK